MEKQVKYRLEVDYYSREYDDKMCEESAPIFSLTEGIEGYLKAIQKKCIDKPEIPATVLVSHIP